uniref:CCHC-type domain-containing protein n=2 Tax=Arion vulgaris TaxID=1028688 RepID=A0A0B6ZSI6_9EUPU
MRQKHAIIGNSQFHKQFLIDFLGWSYTVSEPTRCNVNWEIPLYGQVFNEVYADPANKVKKPSSKRQKPACWNCGEENHAVSECKQPRNAAKIASNRREFLALQQQNQGSFEPKFIGPSRYHLDPELASEFLKFKPGVISEALRQALGLTQDQLPQHIYKMRLFGYPPGWLAGARQIQSGVSIFDKNGRVTLITGECLEDGELEEEDGTEKKTEYDVNKIIEYPGFTIPVPLGFIDEHSTFKMPPIQQHQLKKTLMTQTTDKTSTKKRKREKDQEEHEEAKKLKTQEAGQEDGEIQATVNEEGEMNDKEPEGEHNPEETTEGSTEVAALSPSTKVSEVKITPMPALPRSSSTISLSRNFGTPVFTRENSGLPDPSKFGQGIEEHIPYENLPNSIGTFEKMKDLIDIIRKKNKK